VPLLDLVGLVIAEDVATPHPFPPFDNSAMDGYAMRGEDVNEATTDNPVRLPIVGESSAGSPPGGPLPSGAAVRIMTGAPMPAGADTVVPVEDTSAEDDAVIVKEAVEPGQFVRHAGEEMPAGTIVLNVGAPIHARIVGLLASAGRAEALAYPPPRVGIISTGDELVEPGDPLQPGQIYNSNGYALAALVREAGGTVGHRLHARDTADDLRRTFESCRDCDLIITSGGVSVGSYDFVKDVFAERGTLDFWRVAIRPGKPFAFGEWGKTLFFGLPGNPVSSMVTFELFVRPAIRKMLGHTDVTRPTVQATLEHDVKHAPDRRDFQRAVVTRTDGGYTARLTGKQGSGMVSSMAAANALVIIPEEVDKIGEGEKVAAMLLDG
jgi:molybdopterin molybdotransferase